VKKAELSLVSTPVRHPLTFDGFVPDLEFGFSLLHDIQYDNQWPVMFYNEFVESNQQEEFDTDVKYDEKTRLDGGASLHIYSDLEATHSPC